MVKEASEHGLNNLVLAGVELKPKEQSVFLLRVQGYTTEDIALIRGVARGTIARQIHNIALKAKRNNESSAQRVMAQMAVEAVVRGMVLYDNLQSDPGFTKRQTEVAILMLRGVDSSRVSESFGFSRNNAKAYFTRIDRALGVNNQAKWRFLERAGRLAYVGMQQVQASSSTLS